MRPTSTVPVSVAEHEEDATTEHEQEDSVLENNESDGAEQQTVFDAFMGRDGRACVTTHLGNGVGGYAINRNGLFFKWRE